MFFLSNLCFLCLDTYKKTKSVLIEDSDEMLFDKKLKYCLPEMDVDFNCEIRKYKCSNCISKLEYLYKFKQMCLQNNTYLKSYLQTLASTGESYKHLLVKLSDVKYQHKLQPVSNNQTLTTVGSDDELRSSEVKDEKLEAVFINDMERDGGESPSLFGENDNIVVKEEFILSEYKLDAEFYPELVKNIKCDLISTDSDVSISKIVDIKHEDVKYCNTDSDSETNLTKPIKNKEILIDNEKNHIDIKNYKCSICKKNFMRKSHLIRHETIHTGIKNYECLICKKRFMRKSHLNRHETIHTGIKNYECLICKKKFMRKSHLNRHETIHTGIKNYDCLICNKKFTQKSHLIRHETVHTEIKNYECSICKKNFMRKSHLNRHEIIHTDIKNYECLICKKKFMRKSHLNRHETIHTGIKNYECLICKKKFMRKYYLIEHEKIHTGIKNYECSICKKKFTRKASFIRHERIHTGCKNYECSICKKKFMRKANFIRHEAIHTNKKI